ncbi:MAG: aminoacyl-tRNA hydrolase [Gammaproteobacteria bacterium]
MSDSHIQLIVGLGNPGGKYEATRHNAGFWFVDQLVRRHGGTFTHENKFHGELCRLDIDGADVRVLRPDTYMNESGRAVRAVAQFYKIPMSEVLVAYDEIDLPPGKVKLKMGGGHGGHNGIRDIIAQESAGFLRLRLGVGHPGDKSLVVNYVLGAPGRKEADLIEATIDDSLNVIPVLLKDGVQKATMQLHTSNAAPAQKTDDVPRKKKAPVKQDGATNEVQPKKVKPKKTPKPSRRESVDESAATERTSLKDQLVSLLKRNNK